LIASIAPAGPAGRRSLRVQAKTYIGSVTADKDMKFGVVVARFNSLVTKELLEGAHEVFERHGVESSNIDVSMHASEPACLHASGKGGMREAGCKEESLWTRVEPLLCLLTLSTPVHRWPGSPEALSCPLSPRTWPRPESLMPSFASALW
jgi:hypothetical protein